jgi:hypothetical protein
MCSDALDVVKSGVRGFDFRCLPSTRAWDVLPNSEDQLQCRQINTKVTLVRHAEWFYSRIPNRAVSSRIFMPWLW